MPPEPKERVARRLIEIREIQKLAREVAPERNELLRLGVEQGYTQGELEILSGVEQSQISRIIHE